MRPPPFILVLKSNAPKGPQTRLPGGVLPLELDALNDRDSRAMTVPGSRHPTHGPTLSKYPRQGAPASIRSETGTQGPHGRDRGLPVGVCPFPESGCGLRPQMRRAAACGKPNALLAPPKAGKFVYDYMSITFFRISYQCGANECPAVAFSGGMSI